MIRLFNYRPIFKVPVMIAITAFIASPTKVTYAKETKLDQHDTDIKADIAALNNDMFEGYAVQSSEHTNLSSEHADLDAKLDEILELVGGIGSECSDAWSRVIPDAHDRFELVLYDQAVLDKETCLVWERSPQITTLEWTRAISTCNVRSVGHRKGWRLPTIQELSSLVAPLGRGFPIQLPIDHPFSDVQVDVHYWSQTTFTSLAVNAINGAAGLSFSNGDSFGNIDKTLERHVWCVRGGHGYDPFSNNVDVPGF